MKNKIIKIKDFNRLDTAERKLVNWGRGKKKVSRVKHGRLKKKGKEKEKKKE